MSWDDRTNIHSYVAWLECIRRDLNELYAAENKLSKKRKRKERKKEKETVIGLVPQLYTENWGRLIAFRFSVTFYSIDAVKLNDKGSVIAYVYICVSTM